MDLPKELEGGAYNIPQICITLAALAYDSNTELISELANKSLATQANWSLAWGPVDNGSNRVYVVKNGLTNEYVVAIRGTVKSVESMFIDADSFYLAPLPWNMGENMISDGMSDAWTHINNMVDSKTGQNLYQFISHFASNTTVYVTGHSQGGCLASVVALWLAQTFNHIKVYPITFAAETAGNKAFATVYQTAFLFGGLRVFNPNDIVPMGFADIDKIKHLYGSEPPYVACPDEFKAIINGLESTLPEYVQVIRAYPLPNAFIVKVRGEVHFFNRTQVFFKQVEIQHSCFSYLHLLNAPMTNGAPKVWPPVYINA
ncbi:lipase family protein [uncultured Winogradskyella sp.]|uniref:lipase family protein n=1 Tax=uncultured Winogradskyella sp. TaxID=395353 RepID=UPI0026248651|nr:lipase family protein [uncultured Winogradskyella sp.]